MAGVVCPHCQRPTQVHRQMGYEGFIRRCGLCHKDLPDDARPPSPRPAAAPVTPPAATRPAVPTAEERTATAVAAVIARPERAVMRDAPGDASDVVAGLRAELATIERELERVAPLQQRAERLRKMIAAGE